MEKFLYPSHPVRCNVTQAGECVESCFLRNFILNIINGFGKIFTYSTSLHQDLYQNLYKKFINFIPIKIFLRHLD